MANEKKMDCVILGLLSHEALTGYEIKKRLDTSLRFFWGASYGSIYPTLNGLARDGMVTSLESRENGREKVTYTITETGHEHLKDWLKIPVEKDELRYETLLKLFFGGEVEKTVSMNHIMNFEEKIKKELPMLEYAVDQLEKIKDTDNAHLNYLITAKFGVKVFEAYLEWCEEASKLIQHGGDL